MIESLKNTFFSTKLTALLLVVFATAIGTATFIENDFGTTASKALIFNTRWFEVIIFLLGVNLVGNIFKYKMFRKEKLTNLTYHVALIIIVIGAGVTRYVSFEGAMHIREGEMSNLIVSDDTFLKFKVDNQKKQQSFDKKLYLNRLANKKFEYNFDFEGNEISVAFKDFIPNSIDTVIKVKGGKSIIEIVTVAQGNRVSRYIEDGTTQVIGSLHVAFNDKAHEDAIQITTTDTGLTVLSPYELNYMSMDDQSTGVLSKDTLHSFKNRRLYSIGEIQLVYKTIHESAAIKKISLPKENPLGEDALVLNLSCNKETREVTLFGGKGYVSNNTIFQLDELNFSMSYGSKHYTTPFNIFLNDFKMEKYPGSMSPSSYESEVTLIDNRFGGVEEKQRIYMNNILDYDGYRFFQSSYDKDELGTVLAVNHDFWGTIITYIGYSLLFLGMILTLINKKSRFATLRNNIKKLRTKTAIVLLVGIGSLLPYHSYAQQQEASAQIEIDAEHADKFGHLLVQDKEGRIKPLQTLASEIVRKVTRKQQFNGLTPSQLLLGMIYNPGYFQSLPMIKVKHPQLEKKLGAKDHYVSFLSFFDDNFNYVLTEDIATANRKKPGARTKYDKEVIAVDERANICYAVYQGAIFKIFPKKGDENNTWYTSRDYKQYQTADSIFVKSMLPYYFSSIHQSFNQKDWGLADSTLKLMVDYQQKYGVEVLPSTTEIDMEVLYNKVNIFERLYGYYGLVGFLLLIVVLIEVFNSSKWTKNIIKGLTIILGVLFILHTLGLAARWYISGHAPWSNGYESMIYIAWATILAGFLFSKASKMTLAATSILTFVVLFVAHLNWLDPNITNLVPVLNSYWLMIHVAVITGSYAFLGLGFLLGFINLMLMIFKNDKNKTKIDITIKELTYINEMTLTVGLFMAAIGTFLGGVWANESWGRYWGWDPKETWALVIILVYAMLLHLRFIPKANGKYLFNLLSVWSFGVVIMTYFGVNYYLSGLHSYATGDKIPFPPSLTYTIIIVTIVSVGAYIRNRSLKKSE